MATGNGVRLGWVVGLLLTAALVAQPAQAIPTFSLQGPLSGAPGDTVSADLVLTLDAGDSVSTADFTIAYATGLSFDSATGPLVDDGSLLPSNIGAQIFFSFLPLPSLTGPSDTTLARLAFTILSGSEPGLPLPLTFNVLYAYYIDDLAGGYSDVTITATDTAVTVTAAPIPEPATLLLFGSGLAALAGRRAARRQRL